MIPGGDQDRKMDGRVLGLCYRGTSQIKKSVADGNRHHEVHLKKTTARKENVVLVSSQHVQIESMITATKKERKKEREPPRTPSSSLFSDSTHRTRSALMMHLLLHGESLTQDGTEMRQKAPWGHRCGRLPATASPQDRAHQQRPWCSRALPTA